MVQWLGFWASTAGSTVRSLVGKLRSHTQHGTAKRKNKKKLAGNVSYIRVTDTWDKLTLRDGSLFA